jgi:hypothetical protein
VRYGQGPPRGSTAGKGLDQVPERDLDRATILALVGGAALAAYLGTSLLLRTEEL